MEAMKLCQIGVIQIHGHIFTSYYTILDCNNFSIVYDRICEMKLRGNWSKGQVLGLIIYSIRDID